VSAVALEPRPEPGRTAAALLAAAVHALFALALVISVRWQNAPPEAIVAELWVAPPAQPTPAETAPEPQPPPARAEKPDLAIAEPARVTPAAPRPAAPPPKPLPPAPKREPTPAKQATPAASAALEEAERRMREELVREQAVLAAEREREALRESLAREQKAARDRALAEWIDRVRAKIRGHVVLPPELKGNPEAVFEVVQLPTGEVIAVRLRRSSGVRALDEAVERAILKSSPLPRPERPEVFARSFELRYRPRD